MWDGEGVLISNGEKCDWRKRRRIEGGKRWNVKDDEGKRKGKGREIWGYEIFWEGERIKGKKRLKDY